MFCNHSSNRIEGKRNLSMQLLILEFRNCEPRTTNYELSSDN